MYIVIRNSNVGLVCDIRLILKQLLSRSFMHAKNVGREDGILD